MDPVPNPAVNIHFLYAGWLPLARILVVGTGAYFFLLLTLRTSAPRVLARTNIFDFIVAVGIGSAFGRVLTAKEVALAEACTAFALLVFLQWAVSKLRVRFRAVAALTDAKPELLYFDGRRIEATIRRARLTEADLDEVLRSHGVAAWGEVEAVILEASGDIAVIRRSERRAELLPR